MSDSEKRQAYFMAFVAFAGACVGAWAGWLAVPVVPLFVLAIVQASTPPTEEDKAYAREKYPYLHRKKSQAED